MESAHKSDTYATTTYSEGLLAHGLHGGAISEQTHGGQGHYLASLEGLRHACK